METDSIKLCVNCVFAVEKRVGPYNIVWMCNHPVVRSLVDNRAQYTCARLRKSKNFCGPSGQQFLNGEELNKTVLAKFAREEHPEIKDITYGSNRLSPSLWTEYDVYYNAAFAKLVAELGEVGSCSL